MSTNSMDRPGRWLIAAGSTIIAFAVLALVASEPTFANRSTPDTQLLRTYQPILIFHPSELFRPTKVQSFVNDSELERFVGTSPQQLPLDAYWTVVDYDPDAAELPASTPGAIYRLDQEICRADAALAGRDCYADAAAARTKDPVVYGRAVRTETHIVLQYWLFYYDNPLLLPATQVGTFFQSHEGDWELVNVVLGADEEPVEAAYSQHCSGQRKPWADVSRLPAGSTHPVAYVALGSHANYFGPGAGPLGAIPISPACIPTAVAPILPLLPFLEVVDQVVDGTGAGSVVGPDDASIQRIEGKEWAVFGGRWGESEYFSTPIPLGPIPAGPVPIGLAPGSPANQPSWDVSTILGWPAE